VRTSLDIDDDVLLALEAIARREGRSAGAVASGLLRCALREPADDAVGGADSDDIPGFRPFPRGQGLVTNELIDRLREESGDG
jgi:hypothetical protein